jgi:hypothetical protein
MEHANVGTTTKNSATKRIGIPTTLALLIYFVQHQVQRGLSAFQVPLETLRVLEINDALFLPALRF